MKFNKKQISKKTYHPPQLLVYGDISELTLAGTGKSMDGGMGMGTDKTG